MSWKEANITSAFGCWGCLQVLKYQIWKLPIHTGPHGMGGCCVNYSSSCLKLAVSYLFKLWYEWGGRDLNPVQSFSNSARTKPGPSLFSQRLIVSDELLILQWRSRIFVQKLILFNFYPFWHISYHNNVAQKWVIRDSLWGESCVPLAKMLPRRFLTRIGLYWQTMRLIWLDFGCVPFYLRFYEPRPSWGP